MLLAASLVLSGLCLLASRGPVRLTWTNEGVLAAFPWPTLALAAAAAVIGDALRGQPCTDCAVVRSVSTQLAAEPTVLAPQANRRVERDDVRRWALPSLAAAAAVATVTWMSLETQQAGNAPQFVVPASHVFSTGHIVMPNLPAASGGAVHDPAGHDPVTLGSALPASQPHPAPQIQFSARELQPYLMAHQEFSPSTAIQGLAPYVRTVVSNAIER